MSIVRRWGQPWTRGDAYRVNHTHIKVVTPPQVEPVSVLEAQQFLRVNFTADTALLTTLIAAARQAVERYLRRALITQTLELTLDWGPAWVELPRGPVQAVSAIVVRGLDGSDVVASPTAYFFNPHADLVGLNPAAVWPVHITPAGWRCTYSAGYGDTPSSVPEAIRLVLWTVIANYYDHRGSMDQLVGAQTAALQPYRKQGTGVFMSKGLEPPELLA